MLLSLHLQVSTVTKELKIAFSLYIEASKDVSMNKLPLTIPEMLRFIEKAQIIIQVLELELLMSAVGLCKSVQSKLTWLFT